MANQPLAFAELLAGGVLLIAAIDGAGVTDVIAGRAGYKPKNLADPLAAPSGSSSASGSSSSSSSTVNSNGYIDPLQHAGTIGRTDQGVDAGGNPVGAPIVAPGKIKIMGIIPNWYAGQPLVWFKLLDGPDAGQYQYAAEQITQIAPVGSVLNQGDAIARYAQHGTGIEYGWATASGETLAKATGGYTEGEVTAAGRSMKNWLDSLRATAAVAKVA